jgi:hypothetical protein
MNDVAHSNSAKKPERTMNDEAHSNSAKKPERTRNDAGALTLRQEAGADED